MTLKQDSSNYEADSPTGWYCFAMSVNPSVGGLSTWLSFNFYIAVWAKLCCPDHNIISSKDKDLSCSSKKGVIFSGASLILASVCLKWSPTLPCKMVQSTQLNILLDVPEIVCVSCRTNTFHSMGRIGHHILEAPGTPVCLGQLFEDFISNPCSQE